LNGGIRSQTRVSCF